MVRRSNDFKRYTSASALNLKGSDLKRMDRRELAQAVSTISSAANKRIRRMEKAGQPITETVEPFSVAGKSRNELLKEFRRVREFMGAETQSLSGQRKLARNTAAELAKAITGESKGKEYEKERRNIKNVIKDYGSEESKTFWEAFDRLKEVNPVLKQKQYKYRVLQKQVQIMKKNPTITKEELYERMQNDMQNIYEEVQKEREEEAPGDVFAFDTKSRA